MNERLLSDLTVATNGKQFAVPTLHSATLSTEPINQIAAHNVSGI